MICPSCNTENIPGADFCESCGSDLHDLVQPGAEDAFTEHILTDVLRSIEADEPPPVAPSDPAGDTVDLNALAVRQIMTGDPVVLNEDDTLALALHKMSVGGFRHIPLVADDGQAKRIASIRDVVRHISPFIPGNGN